MSGGNLRDTSSAVGWSMGFYGYAAIHVMPNVCLLLAASAVASAQVVEHGEWRKALGGEKQDLTPSL
jgi:hypothetical protein